MATTERYLVKLVVAGATFYAVGDPYAPATLHCTAIRTGASSYTYHQTRRVRVALDAQAKQLGSAAWAMTIEAR